MNAYQTLPEIKLSYKTGTFEKTKIESSSTAALILRKMYDADLLEYREEFIMILLNRSNLTIGFVKLSTGGLSGTVVDPKMIFSIALKAGASAIILSHNHPSGALKPSDQDIVITKKLSKAGELLDIKILDHVIITAEGYYSFADMGNI